MPEKGAPSNVHPIHGGCFVFPGGKVRPKPGAYSGPLLRGKGERAVPEVAVSK